MELKTIKTVAAVGALALGLASYTSTVMAASVQSGDATPIAVTVTVENTFDVAVVAMSLGQIGAMGHATDTATLTMAPDGTVTDDSDPDASLVSDPSTATTGATVTVTGAFFNTILYSDYDTVVDPIEGGGHFFVLDNILDNMDAPVVGVGTSAGSWVGGVRTQGVATTSGAGALTFGVGAGISTTTGVTGAYNDGLYTGSLSVIVSY